MAVAGCSCSGKLGNTGIPSVKPFGMTSGIVMVPIRADDGTRNGLSISSLTLGQDWVDLLNNPDPSKRGYPYLDLKNVVHEETDANFEEDDKGERFKTRDGIKRITYEKWEVNEQYFAKTSSACVEFGIYEVDVCGNIKGQLDGDNLFPRPANKGSFDAKFTNATADLGSKVMFTTDYKFITNDGNQWMLLQSDFISVIDPLEGLGMIDVVFTTITVDSPTAITVQADFQYGPANALIPFTGALPADFSLLNISTPGVIVVATAPESLTVPGEYEITFAAQTTLDVVELDAFRTSTGSLVNGYEGIEKTFVAQ